ncbi:YggT family protein [Paenibacillus endoradicis]|uniref:YggT family protein n=1 Tax=Paenibacillus endoradicis TaxID=2972487 RepID=UPI00215978D3|nr:YggT family protein [Paenibacillus endoradicis]MCR8656016.1 YggT family protein [Paenibacillus endoradicis]MCR8658342.1 YggT family protein [Paenibacillus endoradicis]
MLYEIKNIVTLLFTVYNYMIIAYILLSWFPNARSSSIGQFLGKIVEPYLSIFRRFIPPIGGMLDISPIVAFIALRFIQSGVMFIIDSIA